MRRKLFTLASVLSLVLFLGTVALWVRSYFVADSLSRGNWVSSGSLDGRMVASARGTIAYRAWNVNVSMGTLSFAGTTGWLLRHNSDTGHYLTPQALRGGTMKHSRNISGLGFIIRQTEASETLRVGTNVNVLSITDRIIGVPHALLAALLALLPLFRLRVARRRARVIAGRCLNCGYDLRATPDRCPECGHAPEQVTA